jgi:hypothetical protein
MLDKYARLGPENTASLCTEARCTKSPQERRAQLVSQQRTVRVGDLISQNAWLDILRTNFRRDAKQEKGTSLIIAKRG